MAIDRLGYALENAAQDVDPVFAAALRQRLLKELTPVFDGDIAVVAEPAASTVQFDPTVGFDPTVRRRRIATIAAALIGVTAALGVVYLAANRSTTNRVVPATAPTASSVSDSTLASPEPIITSVVLPVKSEPSIVSLRSIDIADVGGTSDRRPVVAVAPGNRVAVFDPAKSSVTFMYAAGGDMETTMPIQVPQLTAPQSLWEFVVGPDDVLYAVVGDGNNRIVAFAPNESRVYEVVAQTEPQEAGADGESSLVLGPTGVTRVGLAGVRCSPMWAATVRLPVPQSSPIPLMLLGPDGSNVVVRRGGREWSLDTNDLMLQFESLCVGCLFSAVQSGVEPPAVVIETVDMAGYTDGWQPQVQIADGNRVAVLDQVRSTVTFAPATVGALEDGRR